MLASIATPAPVPARVPEAPAVEILLQRLVAEAQSHPPATSPGIGEVAPVVLLRTTASEAANSIATHQTRREWCCLFCHVGSRAMLQLVARLWMNRSRLCYQAGGMRKLREGLLWCHPGWRRSVIARKTATDLGGGVRHPDQ